MQRADSEPRPLAALVHSPGGGRFSLAAGSRAGAPVREELVSSGWHVRDDASGPGCGNLIATLPGNEELEPLLFSSDMDVVMPCLGVRPDIQESEDLITSTGDTVLGADAKVGVAALLELARLLSTEPPSTRPLVELVFTWGEDVGHIGAKALDPAGVQSRHGWVLDGLVSVGTIILAAPNHYSFAARFIGRGAHAGVEPELGISAISVPAAGIANLRWWRLDETTTANVGLIRGGTVRNAVPAEVQLEGELRSLSAKTAVADPMPMNSMHAACARVYLESGQRAAIPFRNACASRTSSGSHAG